ncbi:MAG: hypothetical protein IKA43_02225 [Clostridia bacterium]|nr:hypothetical protein [Clostridia bacterium]
MKKRILVLVLAILMLTSLFGVVASADDTTPNACTVQIENVIAGADVDDEDATTDEEVVGSVLADFWAQRVWPVTNGRYDDASYGKKNGDFYYTFEFDNERIFREFKLYFNGAGIAYAEEPGQNGNFPDTPSGYAENEIKQSDQVKHVRVELLDAEGEVVYDSEKSEDVSSKTSHIITLDEPIEAKSAVIYFYKKDIWGGAFINEIEIYAEKGTHAYELNQTLVEPTCTTPGSDKYLCECGAKKTVVTEALGHNPYEAVWKIDTVKGTHYNTCLNNCGMRVNEEEHQYDNACDSFCDFCGQTRDVPDHTYVSDCDLTCEACNKMRTPLAEHSYRAVCVSECSNCEYVRVNQKAHEWDNACDNKCNVCDLTRTVPDHVYDAVCDNSCSVCEFVRNDAQDHTYKSKCSTKCSVCNLEREKYDPHTFSNACDATCNECGVEREVPDHVYDNRCDFFCNVCQLKRNTALKDHLYSNDCDTICNECEATRSVGEHPWGIWNTKLEPTTSYAGIKYRNCTSCGEEQTEEIPILPEPEGLSTGAIVAIVVSSVAVVGSCAGVGVYVLVNKLKLAKNSSSASKTQNGTDDDEEYEDDDEYEDDEDDDTQG